VTVTNRANSASSGIHLNVTGGGTFVFAGTNLFNSVDVMDNNTGWYGITGGVSGSTITIPSGASFKTTGYPPVYQYSTFGVRLRRSVTLNVSGSLTTSSRFGGHSGEDGFIININPGAVVTNTGDTLLGWNSYATLNVNGGVFVAAGGVFHQDGSIGYLNLNGGTLETPHVWISSDASSPFYVAFNGGTLKAQADSILEENSDKSGVSTYQVQNGGAVIDSNGKSLEAIIAFARKGSGGLTKQGSGTLTFSGGSYTGATTVTAGTLNLNFNRRSAWVARDAVSDFYDRTSRLVLNGGNLAVTGRASTPSVTRNFLVGGAAVNYFCARVGSTNNLVAGMPVSGLHIPTNTFVTYVKDSSKVSLSKAATNATAATVSLTFDGVTNTTWQTINNIELQQSSTLTVNANGGPGTTLSVGAITGIGSLTKDGNGTLALTGTNTYGGATLIKGGTVKLAALVTVTNASFEVHDPLNEHPPYGYFDTPVNAGWAFSSAGIAALGSTWVNSNAVIDGAYVAFLQAFATNGVASAPLLLPADGQYIISFLAGKRLNMPACALSVEVDGTNKFGFTAAELAGELGATYTGSAVLSGGLHTLTFRAPYTGVDTAIWLDRVVVNTLAGASQAGNLPTGTVVTVSSGAVLDLGAKTQILSGLSGGGLVTNGTLSVGGTVAPGGTNVIGTLTLAAATTLNGTLLVDTALGGTNDLLKVQGSLNLTGSSLQIQDVNQLKSGTSYVIATCTPGGLTGRFASANFAAGTRWHVVYDNVKGEVRLEIFGGTLLRIN
jgi:autotransporter-associated beta strand protein